MHFKFYPKHIWFGITYNNFQYKLTDLIVIEYSLTITCIGSWNPRIFCSQPLYLSPSDAVGSTSTVRPITQDREFMNKKLWKGYA